MEQNQLYLIKELEKKINNLTKVVSDPDGYNSGLASEERVSKLEVLVDEIKKLPSIGAADIQSGTLIVYPDPSNISESNYKGLANVLCSNASAQGFNMVRFMDSVVYLNSGKHKVHSRYSC